MDEVGVSIMAKHSKSFIFGMQTCFKKVLIFLQPNELSHTLCRDTLMCSHAYACTHFSLNVNLQVTYNYILNTDINYTYFINLLNVVVRVLFCY